MDQQKIAGVGNIYASEILFLAGIDPRRRANSLEAKETGDLFKNLKTVLEKAILHGGTSTKDESYKNLNGEKGKMQQYLQVYERTGQKCFRCSGKINKIKLGGRGTYFCPNCQK